MANTISMQTLKRLPSYLAYLKTLPEDAPINVSAKQIADALGLGEIQVRKDLAAVSTGGRPRIGYITRALIGEIESFLGYDDVDDAVLVGVGSLGRALLGYRGFAEYGLNIVAGFDVDKNLIGTREGEKPILPMEKLSDVCRRTNIKLGILTVPAASAQHVCNKMVESGIRAIWSFSPVHLTVPENIIVKTEDLAASLAILSRHLTEQVCEQE